MKRFLIIISILIAVAVVIRLASSDSFWGESEEKISATNAILHLDMKGVIFNGKKFLKTLKKYQEKTEIKAVLVEINSPGGAVGPSQELYSALKNVRDNLKKPVVCVSSGLVASGGYYASLGCSQLIVAPGALIGSIGVIMEFANLEKLYDWAKISRYTITSGKFKDSGAEFRSMRDDEKQLFQSMIDEVYQQFKSAVAAERKLQAEVLEQYTDGRVFTGETAVKAGFADSVGTYEDAVKVAAKLAKLGDNYEVFEVPKRKVSIFDLGDSGEEDSLNIVTDMADKILNSKSNMSADIGAQMIKKLLRTEFLNQPLYLMPGTW
ncbi:MAG: signal peptide peptidase SppA [Bdellovibrionia bacterium]